MSKIAFITDLHFGARGDSIVFHNFFRKFYENIFFPYLKENKIDIIVCLGDIFDKRKQINFVSLEQCEEYFFDKLVENNIHLYLMVGNHDAPYKNTIQVSSPKLLLKDKKNITIIDTPQELVLYDTEFLLCPWLCSDNLAESLSLIEKTKSSILLGHLELFGFEMFKGQMSDHGQIDTALLEKFKYVWSGHYHHKSTQNNITFFGNPYEMSWSDYDDSRGFHVYDTKHDLLEFIPNTYRIFHKFFYDDENKDTTWIDSIDYSVFNNAYVKLIVVNKKDFLLFDTLVHKIQEVDPAELKIIEDFSEFEESAIDEDQIESEDTLTLLNTYIDGVESDVNKNTLKMLMRELYMEANVNE